VLDAGDPFGARIDGLFGMSFLARFSTPIGAKGIELTAVQNLDGGRLSRRSTPSPDARSKRMP
jgi:hypothetical protein